MKDTFPDLALSSQIFFFYDYAPKVNQGSQGNSALFLIFTLAILLIGINVTRSFFSNLYSIVKKYTLFLSSTSQKYVLESKYSSPPLSGGYTLYVIIPAVDA